MDFIFKILSGPVNFGFGLTGNYFTAVLLLALIAKAIFAFVPIRFFSSLRMPYEQGYRLREIRLRNKNDKDGYAREIKAFLAEIKYPLRGNLALFITETAALLILSVPFLNAKYLADASFEALEFLSLNMGESPLNAIISRPSFFTIGFTVLLAAAALSLQVYVDKYMDGHMAIDHTNQSRVQLCLTAVLILLLPEVFLLCWFVYKLIDAAHLLLTRGKIEWKKLEEKDREKM